MLQVTEGPRRRGTPCWTILTNKKELARNANSGGKLVTMITEFRILRGRKKRDRKPGSQESRLQHIQG